MRSNPLKYEITEDHSGNRTVTSLLKVINLAHDDNTTYLCFGQNAHDSATAAMIGLVYDMPEVIIDEIVPVSSSKLFLTWTANSWNLPIKVIFIIFF